MIKSKKGYDIRDLDENQHVEDQEDNKSIPFSFLPLYSQYSQRIKTSLPLPKLFFSSHNNNNIVHIKQIKTSPNLIKHDKESCMFIMDLNGTSAALCYLPTRIKNIIEVYHIEIPINYRNKGFGDQLATECLNWAKQSKTYIIPTSEFFKRHLDHTNFKNRDPVVIVENEFDPLISLAKTSKTK